jgi:hypothetical protein
LQILIAFLIVELQYLLKIGGLICRTRDFQSVAIIKMQNPVPVTIEDHCKQRNWTQAIAVLQETQSVSDDNYDLKVCVVVLPSFFTCLTRYPSARSAIRLRVGVP